jgi:hypothetical protein
LLRSGIGCGLSSAANPGQHYIKVAFDAQKCQ